MLVVGARGLAQEVLQIIEENDITSEIVFYDDVNMYEKDVLFDKYKILSQLKQAEEHFKIDKKFILGLGNPKLRLKLYEKFSSIEGILTGIRSGDVYVGKYSRVPKCATLMSGVKISNGVQIGKALLAYYNVIITHDVKIGNFVELSPGCKLLGHVEIEDEVHVGAGAIILPKLKIGKGAIIGAGAVVTKNVGPYKKVAGVPAQILN